MVEYKIKKKIVNSIKEKDAFNIPDTLWFNAYRRNRSPNLNITRFINNRNTISFRALEYDHLRIVNGIFPFAISEQEEGYGGIPIFTKISDYKRKVYKK